MTDEGRFVQPAPGRPQFRLNLRALRLLLRNLEQRGKLLRRSCRLAARRRSDMREKESRKTLQAGWSGRTCIKENP